MPMPLMSHKIAWAQKMTTKAYLKVQSPKIGCKMGPAQLGEIFSMTSRGPMIAATISPSAATTKLIGGIVFASKHFSK